MLTTFLLAAALGSPPAHAVKYTATASDLDGRGELTFIAKGRRAEAARIRLSVESSDVFYDMWCPYVTTKSHPMMHVEGFVHSLRAAADAAEAGKPGEAFDFGADQTSAAYVTASTYGLVKACAVRFHPQSGKVAVRVGEGVKHTPRNFSITVDDARRIADAFDISTPAVSKR